MSAMVFGLERPFHLSAEADRETDSMNQSVYEEPAAELTLRPRVRTYRRSPDAHRSGIQRRRRHRREGRQWSR